MQFELNNGALSFEPLSDPEWDNEAVFDLRAKHGLSVGIAHANITKETARELAAALLDWADS